MEFCNYAQKAAEKARIENEAKDAQIRALVEALERLHFIAFAPCRSEHGERTKVRDSKQGYDSLQEDHLEFRKAIKQAGKALSSIPAETLELYRLERAVVELALLRQSCTDPEVPKDRLVQTSYLLSIKCMELEAHKAKKS